MEVKKSKDGSKKKKEKSSKSSSSKSASSREKKAAAAAVAAKDQETSALLKSSARPLTEFEMGELFSRYASGGPSNNNSSTINGNSNSGNNTSAEQQTTDVITRDQLKRMLDDLQLTGPAIAHALGRRNETQGSLTPRTKFDLGMLFAQYDPQGKGVIDRQATQAILHELTTRQQRQLYNNNNNTNNNSMLPYPNDHHVYAPLTSGTAQWDPTPQRMSGSGAQWRVAQPDHVHAKMLPPYVPNGTRPMPPYVPKHMSNHNQPSSSYDNTFDYYSLEQQQQQHQQFPATSARVNNNNNTNNNNQVPSYWREDATNNNNNNNHNHNSFHQNAHPSYEYYSNPSAIHHEQQNTNNINNTGHTNSPQQRQEQQNAHFHLNHNHNDHHRQQHDQHLGHRSDTESAHDSSIRRDYLGFRDQVDAALSSRKHHEVRVLNEFAQVEREVKEQAQEYKEKLDLFVQRMQNKIDKHLKSKHARLQENKSQHTSALANMYRFEQLAFGHTPRDALNMHYDTHSSNGGVAVAAAQTTTYTTACTTAGDEADANTLVPPALPSVESLETASLVDFVRCFPDLRQVAERIAHAPVSNSSSTSDKGGVNVRLSVSQQQQRTSEVLRTVKNEPWNALDVEEMENRAQEHDVLIAQVNEKDLVIGVLIEERDAALVQGNENSRKQLNENENEDRMLFDEEKQDTLKRVQALAEASTAEVASWMKLTEKITEDMGAQIATLQEECRVLKQRNKQLEGEEEEGDNSGSHNGSNSSSIRTGGGSSSGVRVDGQVLGSSILSGGYKL